MPESEPQALSWRARGLARLFVRCAEEVLRLKELGGDWPLDDPAAPRSGVGLARCAASCDWSWWPPTGLVDFLLSPLSGLQPGVAWRLDAQWRGDRSLSPKRVLARLGSVARAEGNPSLATAVACLEKGRIGAAAGRLLETVEDPEARAALEAVAQVATELAADHVTVRTVGAEGLASAFQAALDAWPVRYADAPVLAAGTPAVEATTSPLPASFLVTPSPGTEAWTLSASQIESYLECPGKWFALRRLKVGGIDADVTPLQVGTFSHRVLELWGQGLWGDSDAVASVLETDGGAVPEPLGSLPLDECGRAASRAWLGRCWDAHLAHQVLSCRRVQDQALTPHTVGELERLLGSVGPDIDRAAAFVASFCEVSPSGFEVRFGRGEQGSTPHYAGVPVVGSADLLLRDADGRILVVDYKHRSDVTEEYAASAAAPRHIQSLLYASVLGREPFCGDSAAALFLGIGDPCHVAGTSADAVLAELPTDEAVEGVPDFPETCERVERAVAERVQSLLAGDVAPDPRDAEACRYCPALECPRRLGSRPSATADDPASVLLPLVHVMAQPADTRAGLYPLLTGPLFGLSDADLLVLATGTCEETGLPQARRLDRGVLAGEAGLPAGANPSRCVRHALAVLGPVLGRTAPAPVSRRVADVLARSTWLGGLDEEARGRVLDALAALDAHEGSGHGVVTAPAAFAAWLERTRETRP